MPTHFFPLTILTQHLEDETHISSQEREGQRLQAQQIALRDRYIELGSMPDFSRKFAEASWMIKK